METIQAIQEIAKYASNELGGNQMKQNLVSVQFKHGNGQAGWTTKHYDYKALSDDLQSGDLVVVETQYGYTVARVVKQILNSNIANKYVVQKINTAQLEKHKARETQIEFLRADIRNRADAIREQQEMELLAAEDAELKKMLAEMDHLLS